MDLEEGRPAFVGKCPKRLSWATASLLCVSSLLYMWSPLSSSSLRVVAASSLNNRVVLEPRASTADSFDIIANLSNITCVPTICRRRERFEPHTNLTLLATAPGSGNTWTRTIIESGSLLWTGSTHHDLSLYTNGFEGEMLDGYADRFSMLSVLKSHYPFFTELSSPKTSAVIVILRSPYDAALAEFSRIHGQGPQHRSVVSNDILASRFPDYFVKGYLEQWHTFAKFWLDPALDLNNTSVVKTQSPITSFEFTHPGVVPKRPIQVLVMFYEDFIRHYLVASHRMFEFLKHRLGETMPTSAVEAVVCSITKGKKKQVKEKREHKENKYDVYTNSNSDVVKLDLVRKACEQWKPYWFGDVWGECLKATTSQLTRLPISRVDVDRLQNITKYCDGSSLPAE
ncbi:hypothetical protein BASA81_008842 [Batrachochytrium salamandrivorans]|nr:hypothetical protein BASA81_008842 [Batrachochytrium salamandrivorans]